MVASIVSGYTWETISSIQKSKIVKSIAIWFVLLPLFAKAIESETISLYIPCDLKLPFSWGVFYIASTMFFFSSLVYYLRCPEIFKRYSGFNEYLSMNGSASYLATLLLKISKEKKEKQRINHILKFISDDQVNLFIDMDESYKIKGYFKKIDHLDESYHFDEAVIFGGRDENISKYRALCEIIKNNWASFIITKIAINSLPNGENLPGLFSYLREIAETNGGKSRGLILILHSIGFLALAYVAYENIAFVVEYYYTSLTSASKTDPLAQC